MVDAVLFNDTRVDAHHGCTTVIETIDRLAERSGITIIARARAHRDWRDNPEIVEAVDRAQLLIVNGEGTIHHDRPAGAALLAVGAAAKERGIPAALINATWQANGPDYLRALEDFNIVTVRESASEAELASHGFSPRRIADLALYHRPPSRTREGIGYSDNVKGEEALALFRHMWSLPNAHYVSLLHGLKKPHSIIGWPRRFVSSPTKLLKPSTGFSAVRATWQDWSAQIEDRDAFSAAVADKRMMVTGRFHMLIFCLAAKTPMLVLQSNTHKNEATMRDAGLGFWRVIDDPAAIDAALIERAAQFHNDEIDTLHTYLMDNRARMETLFDDLAKLGGASA